MMNYEDVITGLEGCKHNRYLGHSEAKALQNAIKAIIELQGRVEGLVELRVFDAEEIRELKMSIDEGS